MRRILLAGLASLVAVPMMFVAPAAHATAPDVLHGGCFYNTAQNATVTGGENVGVIGDDSATTTGGIPPAPIGATVTCWIEVNGAVAPGTTHSYGDGTTAVQAGIDQISYTAGPADWVQGCYSVAFADGSTTGRVCLIPDPNWPPQWMIDALNAVFGAVNGALVSDVDPVVCPQLVRLAGSYPGGVTIESDGDVIVPDPLDLGLNPFYDCPPYVSTS